MRRTWFIVLSSALACGGGSIGTVGSSNTNASNGVLADFQAACSMTCMHWASCPSAPITSGECDLACNASASSGSSSSLGGVRCADVDGALAQERSCATVPCDQIGSCLGRADMLCAGTGAPGDGGVTAEGGTSVDANVVVGDDGGDGGAGGDGGSGDDGAGGACDICAKAYACCVAELVGAGQPEAGAGTECNAFSQEMCLSSNASPQILGTCRAVLATGMSLNLPACM